MKKNLRVLMIALFVFGIEKLIEFITAVFSSGPVEVCRLNYRINYLSIFVEKSRGL